MYMNNTIMNCFCSLFLLTEKFVTLSQDEQKSSALLVPEEDDGKGIIIRSYVVIFYTHSVFLKPG